MAAARATRLNKFADGAALAADLAQTVAAKLRAGIDARGGAVLAVSGGSTPGKFFEALSREQLAWAKVVVTLVDERFVPPSTERSNERLVREKLLCNEARLARFVGLYSKAATVDDAAGRADAGVALLGPVFDVVILGMGGDGHTASFFPDAPDLGDLTDPAQARRVMPVHAVSAGEPRLTLTMPLIANARFLALHIEGQPKRAVLDAALADETNRLPIARVFKAAASPIAVYWAP
jgi:6-phosphogluconolactonase